MGSGDDVDRVELDNPDPIDNPPQVANVDFAGGPAVGKALSSQGDSTNLSNFELAHGPGG